MRERKTAAARKAEKLAKNKAKGEKYVRKVEVIQENETVQRGVGKEKQVEEKKTELRKKFEEGKVNAKTMAKAMGLKSALVFDEKLVITSFADSKNVGSEAYKSSNIEKVTDFSGVEIEDEKILLSKVHMFTADVEEKKIGISHKEDKTDVPNPARDIGKDYIGIKGELEKEFFGQTFERDNLHVQLAYNILDIKKILGTYINNIIYIFYNLNRGRNGLDEDVFDDLIGTLYVYNSIDGQQQHLAKNGKGNDIARFEQVKQLLKSTSAYFTYFGSVFQSIKEKPKNYNPKADSRKYDDVTVDEKVKDNYDVLRILSLVRQLCTHSVTGGNKGALAESALFNLERTLRTGSRELLDKLNEIYKKSVEQLNASFNSSAANNLYILQQLYPEKTVAELTEDYYRLVIRKEDLNIGLNVKSLREVILEKHFPEILDKEYNLAQDGNSVVTYRSKIYTVMNFILYDELNRNEGLCSEMVNALRRNMQGEAGKNRIYDRYADKVWKLVESKFETCKDLFKHEKENKFQNEVAPADLYGNKVYLSAENTDYFVKLLFFVCKFLDGKEKNELLCAMINKFDNIADLTESAAACNAPVKFASQYMFFENSRQIAVQLRCAKNIAAKGGVKRNRKQAKSDEDTFSERLYLDALALLGNNIRKYKADAQGNVVLDGSGSPVFTEEYLSFRKNFFETFKYNLDGSLKYNKKGKAEKDHKLRNFIANNVLNSKWFFYVVKYNRPAKCGKIMRNRDILSFVLKDIPDAQILRYYKAVHGEEPWCTAEQMREDLVGRLQKFSITDNLRAIGALSDKEYTRQNATAEKEKQKALIRLYLTVAYLITKSLVKVNTRFNIAFSVLERDYHFLIDKNKNTKDISGEEMLEITKRCIARDAEIYARLCAANEEVKQKYPTKEERKPYLRKNDVMLKDMYYSPHAFKYIQNNVKTVENENLQNVPKVFRNAVAHLNVINEADVLMEGAKVSSYYALYCYCLQQYLYKKCGNAYMEEKIKQLKEHRTYCKDLMWLFNLPFAYNLARYKNLSNEQLFYDEEVRNEKETKKTEK